MKKKSCIVCGQEEFNHFLNIECRYSGDRFSLSKCKCSFVVTSPMPSEDRIGYYYENSDYQPHIGVKSNNSLLNRLLRKFSYSWKHRLLKKYIKNKNDIRIIDVGGGDGALAGFLIKKGLSVDVYEKSSSCINFIRNQKIFASNNLSDFTTNTYDVIMLWHSLEHIHDIEELFRQFKRIARKDVVMIIATPNSLASEIDIFKEKWIAWDVPRHLYHFNYKTLKLITEKHGWKVISRQKISQDMFFNIYSSIKRTIILKLLLFIFISVYTFFIQSFFKNKVSSNLIICKRK